jgi:hypothetical protein
MPDRAFATVGDESSSSRSRLGTSASFWRNHNALQLMMAHACIPSVRPVTKVNHMTVQQMAPSSEPIKRASTKVFIAKM